MKSRGINIENRGKALAWWHTLSSGNKNAYIIIVLMQPKRLYRTLTGSEIEQMYNWEIDMYR